MGIFEYAHRTRVICGSGSLERLGDVVSELGLKNVLVVSDPGVTACGHAPRGVEAIQRAGIDATLFSDARENPDTETVATALEAARELKIDGFVGIGGGSSMDTAKAANLLLTHGGEFHEYRGEGKLRVQSLPLVAVPTTAGTGSEVQSSALISEPASHRKMVCRDPKLAPRVAILDPDLTASQPAAVAAATGIDAMAHAIESYVTARRTPVSQVFSREAWVRIARSLGAILSGCAGASDRADMQLGASLAGAAIENSMLGAAHASANPMTASFGVTHGIAVGIMLPHVIRYNIPAAAAAYAQLARDAGWCDNGAEESAAAEILAERVESFTARSPVPIRLEAYGIEPKDFRALADESVSQWTAAVNPRAVAAEDFVFLYEQACAAGKT